MNHSICVEIIISFMFFLLPHPTSPHPTPVEGLPMPPQGRMGKIVLGHIFVVLQNRGGPPHTPRPQARGVSQDRPGRGNLPG